MLPPPPLHVPPPAAAAPLAPPRQRDVAELCVLTGKLLMQHGAESVLIEGLARRVGLALGADRVEVSVTANALMVTTLSGGEALTLVRRVEDRGINMHVVMEVQRAVLDAEARALDAAGFRARVEAVRPLRYPRWLLAVAIGLSCACFARLAHADLAGCAVVLVASGVAMYVRTLLGALHFSPLVNFFATAFVATSLAGLGKTLRVGATPQIAIATCVLLLVPGFPLINGFSDMVKGYLNTGIARLAWATLLSAATCLGVILAMSVWNLWGLP